MNAAQLKASILQQAIEGKLVPQLPEEGVVEQIGDAPTEVPFEIPESWKWFKFPDFVSFNIGKTPDRSNSSYWDGDIPWVAIADITKSDGYIRNTKELISHCALEDIFSNNLAKAGSLLMSFKLSIGKVAFLTIDAAHNEAIISINPHNGSEDTKKFLFYELPVLVNYAETNNAIKGKTLNKNKLKALLIPVPPLAEQKRIVAKIEELIPLVEEYGKAYDKLQELNDELPGKLKASILQEAIQGKLVPQLPEDGVVEQIGKAPAEVPFEIPDSWKWVKIKDVFSMQAGKFIKASEIKEVGAYPCYGGNGLRGFVDNSNRKGRFPIIGRQGALCGNIHVVDGEFYATEHAVVVNCGSYGDPDCVGLFLEQMNLNQYATATAQPGLAVKNIEVLPFPLPPLDEQKRIVAKVNALFEQIDLMTK